MLIAGLFRRASLPGAERRGSKHSQPPLTRISSVVDRHAWAGQSGARVRNRPWPALGRYAAAGSGRFPKNGRRRQVGLHSPLGVHPMQCCKSPTVSQRRRFEVDNKLRASQAGVGIETMTALAGHKSLNVAQKCWRPDQLMHAPSKSLALAI
jgi:hypothetical protein